MTEPNRLVEVNDLEVVFDTVEGRTHAVNGVSFSMDAGETVGIVGESGCGKSVMSLAMLQLVPRPHGKIARGSIIYYQRGKAVEITKLNPTGKAMRALRGNEMAMIFQEPMTSLNPVYTIGEQIMEVLRLHQKMDNTRAKHRAIEMLEKVGVPDAAQRVEEYPHQFSGGMRQRAMIAMALSCTPNLLVADEPTTALDVTIEAQILELLAELQRDINMAVLFISHDLKVIGEIADRVIVMYAGWVVEEAMREDIFQNPQHPYTRSLLAAIPRIGRRERLVSIPGRVPSLSQLPPGCFFAPRCPAATDQCWREEPQVFTVNQGHTVKCWNYWDKEVQKTS